MKINSKIKCLVLNSSCKLIKVLSLLVMLYNSYSCSSTILYKTELKKDYDFAEKKQIGIYTIPSEKADFNEAYSNTLQLHFITKGYEVKDVNNLVNEHSDSIPETKTRKIAEYLKSREYLNSIDLFLISSINLDSIFYATTLDEEIDGNIYHGYNVPRLSTNLAIYDHFLKDPLLSYGAVDTAKLYSPLNKNYQILIDRPWMVAAKQFIKYFDQIPDCSVQKSMDGIQKIKVGFWVDKSYRNTFPKEWQSRINIVALFASEIARNQLGVEIQNI